MTSCGSFTAHGPPFAPLLLVAPWISVMAPKGNLAKNESVSTMLTYSVEIIYWKENKFKNNIILVMIFQLLCTFWNTRFKAIKSSKIILNLLLNA